MGRITRKDAILELERAIADPSHNPEGYLDRLRRMRMSKDAIKWLDERDPDRENVAVYPNSDNPYERELCKAIDFWGEALEQVCIREISLYGPIMTCRRHGIKRYKPLRNDFLDIIDNLFEIYEEQLSGGLFG